MDLPTYIATEDEENYNVELNQSLRDGLTFGNTIEGFTTAQIAQLAVNKMPGTIWFNTDLSKLVLKVGNPAVMETIQSV